MLLRVSGRYEVVFTQDGSYLSYRESGDPAATTRVVKIADLDDVIHRRREVALVREFDGTDGETLAFAADNGNVLSTWRILGVEIDSLFGGEDTGLCLVGDERVCIASYDLEIALQVDRGRGAEPGIDGFLFKAPFTESGCRCGVHWDTRAR